MVIPNFYDEPTNEQIYANKLRIRLAKAKHLSERLAMFLNDIEKSKFKPSDKQLLRDTVTPKK